MYVPSIYIQLLEKFRNDLNFLRLCVKLLKVIDVPPINIFISRLGEGYICPDTAGPLIKAGLDLK